MREYLKMVLIEDIIPYERNPRKNDDAVEAVAESIRQCSYVQPIVVDENMVVLAGHTRLKALKLLEYKKVQVLVCEGLSDETKRKYRYLDNKTGEAAEWNLPVLLSELEGLDLGDLEFFNLGNEEFEVNIKEGASGAIEYEVEGFEDEQFKFECPECGFRFNA